jgi:hypothetical protein
MRQRLQKRTGSLFIIALVTAPLLATTVEKMELPQLVSASDSIVQGRVDSVEARYEANRIYTYVSVTIDDPLKGERRRTVLLRQIGGTIGAKRTWVAGMPQFNIGDQVILFLRDRHDGTFDVTGLNQGKYDIVNDFAVANVTGLAILDSRTGRISEAGFVEKAPLESFKARIRELVR